MELNLERPLLFFDIESTGLSIVSDSIVELSFVKVFPDNHHEVKTWRVCPWDYSAGKQKSIDPGASQVNGIKDEDVANEPKFIEIAPEVVEWLKTVTWQDIIPPSSTCPCWRRKSSGSGHIANRASKAPRHQQTRKRKRRRHWLQSTLTFMRSR